MRNEQVAIVCNRPENLALGGRGRGRGRDGKRQTPSPPPHPAPQFRAMEEKEKQKETKYDGGFVYGSMNALYEVEW